MMLLFCCAAKYCVQELRQKFIERNVLHMQPIILCVQPGSKSAFTLASDIYG